MSSIVPSISQSDAMDVRGHDPGEPNLDRFHGMKEIRGSKVLDLLWASLVAPGGAFSFP
jgi:hypothetical protein